MTNEPFADIDSEEFDEYDPLDEVDTEDEEDESDGEVIGTLGTPHEAEIAETDPRSPEERIADLFQAMAPRRKTLLGILSFCQERRSVEDLNARIDELQENNFSVFSPANLCKLLEDAGAIVRVTEDGTPYDEVEIEPVTVEIDGIEYYEVAEPPKAFWLNTPEGQAYLDADNPLERLKALLRADAKYASVYETVFDLVSKEGGVSMKEISNAVDDMDILKKPRLYAPHFIDKLEKCDAVEWKKAWIITDIGREGIAELSEIAGA